MDLILHIGQQKTASTNIQHRLAELRPKLRAQDILYSYAFGKNKANRLKWTIQKPADVGAGGQSEIESLQREIEQDYKTLILSQETFFSVNIVTINLLRDLLGTRRKIRIYVYLRPPLEHILSYYQQKVNGFGTQTLDEFIQRVQDKKYYFYASELDRWASAFGADAIHARVFTPENWSSPVENFLEWIGIDPSINLAPSRKETRTRSSLDPASTELLRTMNLFYYNRPDLMSEDFAFEFRDRVQAIKTGERLALDERQAAVLRDSVTADIEALSGRYLPESDVQLLLRPPRTPPAASRPVDGAIVMARAVDVLCEMETRFPPGTSRDEVRAMLQDYGQSQAAACDAEFAALMHRLATIGFSLKPARSSQRSAEAIERRRQKLKRPKKETLGQTGDNAAEDLTRTPETPGAAATNGRLTMDQDQTSADDKKPKRSPEEQVARAEKKTRKEEKLAALTPEQRAAKDEKRAARKKAKEENPAD